MPRDGRRTLAMTWHIRITPPFTTQRWNCAARRSTYTSDDGVAHKDHPSLHSEMELCRATVDEDAAGVARAIEDSGEFELQGPSPAAYWALIACVVVGRAAAFFVVAHRAPSRDPRRASSRRAFVSLAPPSDHAAPPPPRRPRALPPPGSSSAPRLRP